MRHWKTLLGFALLGFVVYFKLVRPHAGPPPAAPAPPPPAPERRALPSLSSEEIEKVIGATHDTDPQVRLEAAKFLAEVQRPETDTALLTMMLQDSEASIRRQVLTMVENRKGPEVLKYLTEALHDQDSEMRTLALKAIARSEDPSAIAIVSEAIHDSDERVRMQAIVSLNQLQNAGRSQHSGSTKRSP